MRPQSRPNWGPTGWPKPRPIVLQDRETGTLYLLSHDSETDDIVLTTPVPSAARTLPEEPYLLSPQGLLRLYVDDGQLTYEVETRSSFTGIVPAPVFTLNYDDLRTTYLLHGTGATEEFSALCLVKYSSLGLVTEIEDLGCFLDLFALLRGILDTAGVVIADTAGVAILDTE